MKMAVCVHACFMFVCVCVRVFGVFVMCVQIGNSPVYGQMERLGDRRPAGMSYAQAGVHV